MKQRFDGYRETHTGPFPPQDANWDAWLASATRRIPVGVVEPACAGCSTIPCRCVPNPDKEVLGTILERLDTLERRLDSCDNGFERLDRVVDRMFSRLESLERRVHGAWRALG